MKLSRPKRLLAAAASLLVAAGVAVGVGAAAAAAAPTYDTTATVDTLKFTDTQIVDGTRVQLEGTWSIPNNPTPTAGFSLGLPPELTGFRESFDLAGPGGATVGTCTVSATEIFCTLDPTYITDNPLDLHGTFKFWVTVKEGNKTTVDKEYPFVNYGDVPVTVTPNPLICQSNCDWTGRDRVEKTGRFLGSDTILWSIYPPQPVDGFPAGRTITITDTPGANQTIRSVTVYQSTEIGVDDKGREQPVNWVQLPATAYSVNSDNTVITLTTVEHSWYSVDLRATVTGGAVGDTYTNSVTVQVDGQDVGSDDASTVRPGGTGTGIGDNVGRFAVTKTLDGDAAVDPALEFQLAYAVTTPDGVTTHYTGTVTAGGVFTSPEFPKGSVVELTEVAPTDSASVVWSAPVFDLSEFTLVGATETAISLTNTATLQTGSISVAKALVDPDALVEDTATFAVDYSYPAGDGYPAGNGTVQIPATGTPVTIDGLPVGAVVTLAEQAPADVPGATWHAIEYSAKSVTVDATTVAAVTVTNTISLDTGAFSVVKQIDGDGAALVPADTVFVVDYSYPAGDTFDAGSGTLKVAADGTPSESPRLPVGAVVTLSEATPAGITGGTWSGAVFTPSTLTIGKDAVAQATLVNTFTKTPPPTPTPSETSTPTPSTTSTPTPTTTAKTPLATTGTDAGMLGGVLAVGLLVVAGGLVAVGRARRV